MKQLNLECKRCGKNFVYDPQDVFFDDKGYGYSTKLVKCKYCDSINIIKYYEDRAMKLNNDSRFYDYTSKSFGN